MSQQKLTTPPRPVEHDVERVLADNADAFHEARRYMQTAAPYAPKSKATQLRELLASWGQSDFATVASGEGGENLLNALVGQLAKLEEIEGHIASLSTSRAGWQPIETAPKDGRDVLLYYPLEGLSENHPRTMICHWNDGKGMNSPGFWVWQGRAYRGYSDSLRPTHWMPLPEPPPPHSEDPS